MVVYIVEHGDYESSTVIGVYKKHETALKQVHYRISNKSTDEFEDKGNDFWCNVLEFYKITEHGVL